MLVKGNLKEVYSNLCMKIHISSKVTQYLILNIFKTRFLMRNCLKKCTQMPKWNLKKTCRATMVPYSVMWTSLRYYVHNRSIIQKLVC